MSSNNPSKHRADIPINILSNAIDALEESHAGRSDREINKNPHQIRLRTSVIDARWVEIAIADNGSGIPKEIQQRIFDPFFSLVPLILTTVLLPYRSKRSIELNVNIRKFPLVRG